MNRKIKVLVHLLLIVLSVMLFYLASGCPPFSSEMAFHRAEQAQLVGPSKIIGYEDVDYWFGSDKAIVGETEQGYTLFEYHVSEDGSIFGSSKLSYHPTRENITLFCSSEMHPHTYMDNLYMPVFLFCDNLEASYAELELYTTDTDYTGEVHEYTYCADAQRSDNGYFLFKADFSGEVDLSSVDYIQLRLSGQPGLYPSISGTATVRLYGKNGDLLETHVLDLDELPSG